MDKCNHIERVSIHRSIRIGGVSVGNCKNEAAPGFVKCWDHLDKEPLILRIKMLEKEIEDLKKGK